MRFLVTALRASALLFLFPPSAFAVKPPAAARSSTAPAPPPTEAAPLPVDKHTREILAKLKLQDPKKEAAAQSALITFFAALATWHKTNDAQLKTLWADFNKAHAAKDTVHANDAIRKIDLVYASFQSSHESLVTSLRAALAPEEIEALKNVFTANKVKATYKAYQDTFSDLTPDQASFILQNLKAAREEAMNSTSSTEKSGFFLKYKIKIEAYLTAQGFDVNKSYEAYVAKQKAEMEAKNAPPPAKPKKN